MDSCPFKDVPKYLKQRSQKHILCVNGIKITIRDLKSLQPEISKDEAALLRSSFPSFVSGWLTDTIIDAFLLRITDGSPFTVIPCGPSTRIINGGIISSTHRSKLEARLASPVCDVLFPFNSGNHWILFHLSIIGRQAEIRCEYKY